MYEPACLKSQTQRSNSLTQLISNKYLKLAIITYNTLGICANALRNSSKSGNHNNAYAPTARRVNAWH